MSPLPENANLSARMAMVPALVCTVCNGVICTACGLTEDGELINDSECAGHFMHEPGECPWGETR